MATHPSVSKTVASIRNTSGRYAYEKRNEVTQYIVENMKSSGTFFRTPSGLFYFRKEGIPKLYPLEEDSFSLSFFICDCYGINPAETRDYRHLLAGLRTEAHLRGQPVLVRRLSHFETANSVLYVSRFDGWVYRIDGRDIQSVPNGTDGVFFWDDPQWQPYEMEQENLKEPLFEKLILDSANFSCSDQLNASDQRWILKKWLLAQFFASLHPTKPLLLVCGEKGGGKSAALRKWLKLLFGESSDVTALERAKADGFIATISSQPIAVFDNVDDHVAWLPDHLAQLATGVSFRRRKYYTTNEEVTYKPCCWVALTSRTPRFVEGRDDVLDRTIILHTERRLTFKAEIALLTEIQENRNQLWTELLRELNEIVAYLSEFGEQIAEVRYRMADFASFTLLVAAGEDDETRATYILSQLERRQNETLLSDEPIKICLGIWLNDADNGGREISSCELNKQLAEIAVKQMVTWPHPTPNSLAQKLTHIWANLSQHFETQRRHDSSNQCHYRFWQKVKPAQINTSR